MAKRKIRHSFVIRKKWINFLYLSHFFEFFYPYPFKLKFRSNEYRIFRLSYLLCRGITGIFNCL
ncbi:hypothetical protein BpHYR1_042151 [Brachionus plicatilis]|uniref:Uncharacterized protein n=1 Tax=Brachionus plicatilis TaxID=10195 RepID=A0A3M7PB37_BRAPC|nr:hypothetical protein BpHYR1_042151 [Brachionus plicatilis]